MSDPRWLAVRAIVERAVELPREERDGFVRRACAADPELADAGDGAGVADMIHALLERDGVATEQLLARGVAVRGARQEATLAAAAVGAEVGPYRLLALLGVGGAGAVYRAQRIGRAGTPHADEPGQEVALKLLGAGGAGAGFVAPDLRSFRRERTLLARLDHAAIPRLLDAGITDEGTPWLALELVEGERIDRHCDARSLPLRERLALFTEVCAGVQHAHEQRVVHRDLKPQNLLVTAAGRPRLLDFGIARLLEGDRARTLVPLLTPQYASPEQFRGSGARVENDVYALGAILFELLCGVRPYRVAGLSLAIAARIVAGGPPRPPSVAFARLVAREPERARAIAAARATTIDALERELRGGLDAVILRAMDPDPLRRHASVAALQRDLVRHLDGRRPGWHAPRPLRALAARPRRAIAVLALAVAVGALGGLVVQFVPLERPTALAAEGRLAATLASAALTKSLDVTSRMQPGKAFVTLEWLESTALDLELVARDDPALAGEGLAKIGEQCRALRLPNLALRHFETAAKCFLDAGDPARGARVRALCGVALARADVHRGDATAAADAALAAARALEPAGGRLTSESLFAHAVARARAIDDDAAQTAAADELVAAEAALTRTHGDGSTAQVRCRQERAQWLLQRGRAAEAEPLARSALEQARARGDERIGEQVALMRTLAGCLAQLGRGGDAESQLLAALSLTRTRIDEAWTPPILVELAELMRRKGDLRLAELYAQRALALHALRAGAGNSLLTSRLAPAIAELTSGSGRAARPACAQVHELLRRRRPDESYGHYDFAQTLVGLARIWLDDGDPEPARSFLRHAACFFEQAFGAANRETLAAWELLATIPPPQPSNS